MTSLKLCFTKKYETRNTKFMLFLRHGVPGHTPYSRLCTLDNFETDRPSKIHDSD